MKRVRGGISTRSGLSYGAPPVRRARLLPRRPPVAAVAPRRGRRRGRKGWRVVLAPQRVYSTKSSGHRFRRDEEANDVVFLDNNGLESVLPDAVHPHNVTHRQHQGAVVPQNFYINPKMILDFFAQDRMRMEYLDRRDEFNLDRIGGLFNRIESSADKSFVEHIGDRDLVDPNDFFENEVKKLHPRANQKCEECWNCPYLSGTNDDTLTIPAKDVIDLPEAVFLYILRRLAQFPRRSLEGPVTSFSVSFKLGTNDDDTRYPVHTDRKRTPVCVKNGKISMKNLGRIFMAVMRRFAMLMGETTGEIQWNGSEESGTRVMLYNMNKRIVLKLKLFFTPLQSVHPGHKWTPEIEKLLEETVGTSVITVKNVTDNKCLIYCIIMGMIIKFKETGQRAFGTGIISIPPEEVYCKGMFLFAKSDDELTNTIKKLTRLLMPPSYSDGPIDPMVEMVREIDKQVGTTLSMKEFEEKFAEIEACLIPNNICGIDVYGIDYNVNKHVYPLYISKNREKTIELLCVTPKDIDCSHYCLVLNMDQLMKGSGGKQFFSCSKCGHCFYHRRLLRDHKCPARVDQYEVDGDGGFHYSRKDVNKECDIICGACTKCRLCFVDDFAFNYHKEHCLMEGQTGYRHVQLVTYKPDEHPTLNGEEIDMAMEDNHANTRYVLYADFECSINPETGEHSFMSYGLFDSETGDYMNGTTIADFVRLILRIAFSDDKTVYVYFHNAMGYDANFILRHVLSTPEYKDWGIQVIMKSSNKLQKLVFHAKRDGKTRCIHIGDTFLFLTLSLERLVDSIRKDDIEENKKNFPNFFSLFKERYWFASESDIDHILRKNIFPYKFFTDPSKLKTRIEDFIEIFNPFPENLQYFSERVTLLDLAQSYNDTRWVIETFRCKTAEDYHDLYLRCDVLQLADIFTRCMEILWESHHIHLTKYLGMPSASWAAFLRHDPSMSIPLYEDTFFAEFFKGMVRGGITSAALRYAKADEKHFIIYLDVNGLYPYVMQAYKYPCGNFKFVPMGWTSGNSMAQFKLQEYFKYCEENSKGMCFCVDLEIPPEVQELTDMYPFAPEHRKIYHEYYRDFDKKEMTPFLKRWSAANNGDKMPEFTGLVCTLYSKTKYNVHWRLLKFYMEHGVIVKKVWFGVEFDEGDYLASYIRKNIEIRNGRKDELGKTVYKLLGNSVYGKTFESPFKRNTFEIITDETKLQGLLAEGNIAAMIPIDNLGWIVRFDGEDIVLDKPTYIGACVCEYSKLHMYTLLYDKLMSIFPRSKEEPNDPGCQLVYTDTDSFIVRVRCPDGEEIHNAKELFDYIKSKDPTLIGGIGGQVKSETGEDDTIDEIIALRSKVYAYKTTNGHIGKRAKGTTHDAQEMQLDWETYKEALDHLTSINTHNSQIARKIFKLSSVDVERQSLSVNDGKRFICKDGIHTHAFGYPIPPEEMIDEEEEADEEAEEFRLCRQAEREKYETLDDD